MSEPGNPQEPVVRDKRRIDPDTGEVRRLFPDQAGPGAGDDNEEWTGYGEDELAAGSASGGQTPQAYTQAANAYNEFGPSAEQPPAPARPFTPPPGQPGEYYGAASGGDGLPDAGEAIQALERQLAERTADVQRVQAEYANYRRRVERDREAVREQALVNVLTNLLPLLDDISRAREHGDLTGGFKSVGEALEAAAEKLGLSRYGEPGEPFDPTVHEALTHTYSAEVSEPMAVAVLQPGYRLGQRVLRPARVAVAEPEQ